MTAAALPEIGEIADADLDGVVALWRRAGLTRRWNDPLEDIALARASQDATVLVAREHGRVLASVMVGHDGHRGAYYYLSVAPDRQGDGLGRAIVAAAEAWLRERGIWKVNLLVRTDNLDVLGFYERLGYGRQETLSLGKWLDESRKPPG